MLTVLKFAAIFYAACTERSTLLAPLRILAAIMILVMPPTTTEIPTSVPIAQRELDGHLMRINMPNTGLTAVSTINHPQPAAGRF